MLSIPSWYSYSLLPCFSLLYFFFFFGGPNALCMHQAKAMETFLILHMDHEQNASTSTVRIAGSSQANPFACIASGIGSSFFICSCSCLCTLTASCCPQLR